MALFSLVMQIPHQLPNFKKHNFHHGTFNTPIVLHKTNELYSENLPVNSSIEVDVGVYDNYISTQHQHFSTATAASTPCFHRSLLHNPILAATLKLPDYPR